jgi:hypothetical protein
MNIIPFARFRTTAGEDNVMIISKAKSLGSFLIKQLRFGKSNCGGCTLRFILVVVGDHGQFGQNQGSLQKRETSQRLARIGIKYQWLFAWILNDLGILEYFHDRKLLTDECYPDEFEPPVGICKNLLLNGMAF